MSRKIFLDIISALLILLFVYTAASKLIDFKTAYGQMNNQPFPNWMTIYLVWGIIISELAVAAMLMFNRTKKAALWGSTILMILFTSYVGAILLHFFDRVPCSCGGVIKELGWVNHLYFNLFFLIISVIGLILSTKRKIGNEIGEVHDVVFT